MSIVPEILKLRTIRSPWILLVAAQLVIVAGAAGPFATGDRTDPAIARAGAAHLGLTALFTLVLGILAVAGEHRHRTITDTYLTRPRRSDVLTAKLVVYTGAGVGFGLVGAVTAVAATAVAAAATGVTVDWSDPDLWRTVAGGVLWNISFAALGVALGALLPNPIGAITGALAWFALVEGVVAQLVGSTASQWLPFAAGAALGALPTAADQLPQLGAAALLGGYVLVLAGAALAVTNRRDIV
jgi:ABC-2 type transport system permease protein